MKLRSKKPLIIDNDTLNALRQFRELQEVTHLIPVELLIMIIDHYHAHKFKGCQVTMPWADPLHNIAIREQTETISIGPLAQGQKETITAITC